MKYDVYISRYIYIYISVWLYRACPMIRSCGECVEAQLPFSCMWCSSSRQCIDQLDFVRQLWLQVGCSTEVYIVIL